MTNGPDSPTSPDPALEPTDGPWSGLDFFVPSLMNRIMMRYNDRMQEALRAEGLTVPQMRILTTLADRGPCTINELSEIAVAKQPTVSRTVDALEEANLVRRAQCPLDSRVRRVHLLPDGEALGRRFVEIMLAAQDRLLEPVSEADRRRLTRILRKILLASY